MGTRGLTAVQVNGEYKIAQYGQWDHYPSGQGKTALDFAHRLSKPVIEQVKLTAGLVKQFGEVRGREIAEGMNVEALFASRLQSVEEISSEEMKARWTEAGADPESDFVNLEVAKNFDKKYPWLSRNAGAEVLNYVLLGVADKVQLNIDFAEDSLFCEWAYVIDLDRRTFEVYKGFNVQPIAETERFYKPETALTTQEQAKIDRRDERYYPIRLLKSYSLDELPTQAQMEKDCDPPEPEEAEELEDGQKEALSVNPNQQALPGVE